MLTWPPIRLVRPLGWADTGTVTDPQAWILIVGFFSIMVALAGTLLRWMRTEFRVVRVRIDGVEDRMNARFDGVDARFDSMGRRIDLLDPNVQRLVDQHFRES